MPKPFISIIIPTYNRAHLICETLDSIKKQTYAYWECIIVDDGSTDDTEALIGNYTKKDNRFYFYKRPENRRKGPGACRNYGFEMSKGDFIHFMDSDDLYYPYSLEIYTREFRCSCDAVVAKVETTDFKTGEIHKVNSLEYDNLIEDFFVGSIIFYVSGPMWKKTFLQSKILFDEEIRRQDDWDFNIRMLLEKPQINFLDIALINYRKHNDSLNSEVSKLNLDEINSHIYARNKIEALIKNSNVDVNIDYRKHLGNFYKLVFKKAMLMKHPVKYLYFKKLLFNYLQRGEIIKLLYVVSSFFSFNVLGRGYSLLKKI